VILHETIHELHTKKFSGVILKLDFGNAYDKIKWSFSQQTLRMKGFRPQWCTWITNFVFGGNVDIKVNDDIGQYFQTKKMGQKRRPHVTHPIQCCGRYALYLN
jgi:hypothetical protein